MIKFLTGLERRIILACFLEKEEAEGTKKTLYGLSYTVLCGHYMVAKIVLDA